MKYVHSSVYVEQFGVTYLTHQSQLSMSAVPELKKKKLARDAEQAKKAAAAAAQAAKDEAESAKVIFAKAKAYEEEYQAVRIFC